MSIHLRKCAQDNEQLWTYNVMWDAFASIVHKVGLHVTQEWFHTMFHQQHFNPFIGALTLSIPWFQR
jgi:aspartate/tyrosine/aromatic aminotransferase